MDGKQEHFDLRGVLWMLASAVLFAGNTLLIRAAALISEDANGWVATFFRGAVGVFLLLLFYSRGKKLSWRRMFGNRLVVMRGVVGSLSIICFYVTIVHLGAGRSIVINLTYPMFGTVIAAYWLKERVDFVTKCWLVIALVGLVIFLSDGSMGLQVSFYDVVGLVGAIASGFVIVIIRKLRSEEHPATIYGSLALGSLVIGLPFAGAVNVMPMMASWYLVIGAVVVTIAQLFMTAAYQRLPVARGASLQMTLPIFTGVGAYFMFGERFAVYEYVGALVTLVAIWRVAGRRRREAN